MKKILVFLIAATAANTYASQLPAQNIAGDNWRDTAQVTASANLRHKSGAQSISGQAWQAPVSVQILVGGQGIGADLKYGFLPKLSGRAGFGLVPVTVNNLIGFSSFSSNSQLSARFANIHLLADYAPFKTDHFRIVAGGAYIIRGNANLIVSPNGTYQFGNTTVNKNQIGIVNADVTWKGAAPYLGAAFFNGFPNRLFNINLDVGVYYLSSPATSLTGTQMLSPTSSEEPQFNQNMQGYHWLPVIQLNFNFRIK